MLRIAIVEDEENCISVLKGYLQRYKEESGEQIEVTVYHDGDEIAAFYRAQFDIILMDIEMKFIDGMTAAEEIRKIDSSVFIIFITNAPQYAIRGYEVSAIDFMVKPVNYYNFVDKLKRAIDFSSRRARKDLVLRREDEIVRVPASDLVYVEKDGNNLVYHTRNGEFRERGSMQALKAKLDNAAFSECMSGCLVNLAYVEKLERIHCYGFAFQGKRVLIG